jgi:putative membrane protein
MKRINIFTATVFALGICAFIPATKSFAQSSTKLTDPEIASVAVVANQNDIGFATIAKTKSTNKDVLQFAQTMATDHQSVIDQATALVKKLGVTPKDNAVSKKLLSDAGNTKKMLSSKSGDAFNKAYIDNEVSYHKAVITEVENVLIPDATNKDLKDLLQKVLPILKTHLEHAEMLQKKFNT